MTTSTLKDLEAANEIIIQENIKNRQQPKQLSDEEIAYDIENFTGY